MRELTREVLERFRSKPFNWSAYYGSWPVEERPGTCAEEFELLRRQGVKISTTTYRQMQHLEWHLDRGDVVCNCGKE